MKKKTVSVFFWEKNGYQIISINENCMTSIFYGDKIEIAPIFLFVFFSTTNRILYSIL